MEAVENVTQNSKGKEEKQDKEEKHDEEEKHEKNVEERSTSPISEPIAALNLIYENLNLAQAKTGAFSLADSRNVIMNYKMLLSFFNDLDKSVANKTSHPLALAIHYNANVTMFRALEVQRQSFTIEGAAVLLARVEFLENVLNSVKDPNLVLNADQNLLRGHDSSSQESSNSNKPEKTPGEKVKEKIAKKKDTRGKKKSNK